LEDESMMQLMISVLSAEEARVAAANGADILDVKNPAEGSLGAQFPRVIKQVVDAAAGHLKVSAAIGDMPNLPGTASLAALGAAVCGVDYIKVGLFGSHTEDEAVFLLREVRQALCDYPSVVLIAAGYADFQRAGTLNPRLLPRLAAKAGAAGCLVDTAVKDGCSLFDFLAPQALKSLADDAHAAGLIFGLAGSLLKQDLLKVRELGADVAGVRTAVCQDNRRSSPLDGLRVRQLSEFISNSSQES
jgi:uncharacterized protein (UPF0264 family)